MGEIKGDVLYLLITISANISGVNAFIFITKIQSYDGENSISESYRRIDLW